MRRSLTPLVCFIPFLLAAQGSWIQQENLPDSARQWAVGFSIDASGYIATGMNEDSVGLSDLWEYDITTETWTERASMPVTRIRGVGMALGDKGYVGTGTVDGMEVSNDWWMYDPTMDEWTAMADLPGPARTDAIGFALNDKCYVGGGLGAGGTSLSDLYEYDPITDSWTQKQDLPLEAPRSAAASFVIGDLAYTVGGRTEVSGIFTDVLYVYDPVLDQWNVRDPFPGSARLDPVAFVVNENFAVVGTGDDGDLTSDFYVYDYVSNTWMGIPEFPGAARTRAVGFNIGDHGFVATGSLGAGEQSNELWEFIPGTTSIVSTSIGPDVVIYPNPSTGPVKVILPEDGFSGTIQLSVLNVVGQEIWERSSAPINEITLDLSQLPQGTYFLRIQDNSREHVKVFTLE